MLGTSATRLFHLMAQRFPGPMHADGGILRGNARLLRQITEGSVLQIHHP